MPHATDSHAPTTRDFKEDPACPGTASRAAPGLPRLRAATRLTAHVSPASNGALNRAIASDAGESHVTTSGASQFVVSLDEFRKLIAISQALTGAVIRLYTWAAVAGEQLGIEEEPVVPQDAGGQEREPADQG